MNLNSTVNNTSLSGPIEIDKRVYYILCMLYATTFLAFSFYSNHISIIRYLRLPLLAILILYAATLNKKFTLKIGGNLRTTYRFYYAFILYMLFNILTSINIINTAGYFIWLVASLLFLTLIFAKLSSKADLRLIIYSNAKAMFLVGIMITVVSFVEGYIFRNPACFDDRYLSTSIGTSLQKQFGGICGNANTFSMILTQTMLALLIIFEFNEKFRKGGLKFLSIIIFIILAAAIIHVGSRSAMLGMIITFSLYQVYYKKKWGLLLLGIPLVIYFIISNPKYVEEKFRTSQFEEENSFGNRTILINDAIRIIQKMNYFGVGYANQKIARVKYAEYEIDGKDEDMHFHNTYLALIVELGYAGFALFFLFLAFIFLSTIKQISSSQAKAGILKLLLCSLAPILLVGLSEDSINMAGSPVFIYFWINIFVLVLLLDSNEDSLFNYSI